jgi:hypothetical protein
MVNYQIVPRGRAYWVEGVGDDGSRHIAERFNTESEAVRRLHELQEKAGMVKPKRDPIPTTDQH